MSTIKTALYIFVYLYLSNNGRDSSSNVFCNVSVSSDKEGGAGSTDL